MIYLFVDANIYIGSGYVFHNDFFSAIEKYSAAGEVKLLTCSICINEVKKHIKMDVEESVREVNKKIKKGIFFALRSDTRYKDSYIGVEEELAVQSLTSGFENYLSRVEAEIFPIEGIGIEDLMEDYYQMNPPFEPEKPKEFKDAIMIKALKNYQKLIGEEIHIVSNDMGFRTSFLNDKLFIVYEYHKKFLQFLSRRKEVCYAFEKYCQDERNDEITEIICESIQDCEFCNYNEPEFELLDEVEIEDIQTEFLYCEIIDEENVKIHVSADIGIKINARYLDEENSCYDHEEKEYIYRSYLDVIEQHGIQVEIVLNGAYTMDESDEEDIIEKYGCYVYAADSEVFDLPIELDELTLNELISRKEYVPAKDRAWFKEESVYCSECRSRIGFKGDECYFTGDDEPLCDDCMVDNGNGFVCPNCSKKYPEFMRGNSGMFCIYCEQDLDV